MTKTRDLHRRKSIPCSWVRRLNVVQMSVSPNIVRRQHFLVLSCFCIHCEWGPDCPLGLSSQSCLIVNSLMRETASLWKKTAHYKIFGFPKLSIPLLLKTKTKKPSVYGGIIWPSWHHCGNWDLHCPPPKKWILSLKSFTNIHENVTGLLVSVYIG